jgi:hypothetical protein
MCAVFGVKSRILTRYVGGIYESTGGCARLHFFWASWRFGLSLPNLSSSTARLLGASNQDANYSVRTLGCPILNIDVIISRPSGNVRTGANAGSVLTFGRRAMIPKTGSPRPSRVSIYPHLC